MTTASSLPGPAKTTAESRGARVLTCAELLVPAAATLAAGCLAGATSLRPARDIAAANGQPGWLASATAIVLALTPLTASLELRRRARTGRPRAFSAVVLACALTLGVAAQLPAAEPSVTGWLLVALPAMCLAAMTAMRASEPPDCGPSRLAATPSMSPVR